MNEIESQILACLSYVGADTVTTLRGRTPYKNLDARSQATIHTGILKKLEARGLVRRLDDQKPIAWLKVARQWPNPCPVCYAPPPCQHSHPMNGTTPNV